MGAWTPYSELLRESLRPTCKVWGGEYREADADSAYEVIPTWGPHDDVPAGLSKIAGDIPLVILSNAMDEHIDRNVGLLGAPFHAIYTAQMAQAQKPRMIGFDYIFDQLGRTRRHDACVVKLPLRPSFRRHSWSFAAEFSLVAATNFQTIFIAMWRFHTLAHSQLYLACNSYLKAKACRR
ncbi:hypothetical protein [Sphingomonas sp. VDB2]|uniref:hypothetical protein n=1 Tax=Sphingomonas sp. VDB2 TaxID=3228751 RepID=UPI003A80E3FC